MNVTRNSERENTQLLAMNRCPLLGLRARACPGVRSTTTAESGQAEVNAKENKWKDSKPPFQSVHAYLIIQLAKFH